MQLNDNMVFMLTPQLAETLFIETHDMNESN